MCVWIKLVRVWARERGMYIVCVEERAACRIVDSEAEGGRGDDSEQGVGHGGGPARDHHQRVQLFDRLVKSDLTSLTSCSSLAILLVSGWAD